MITEIGKLKPLNSRKSVKLCPEIAFIPRQTPFGKQIPKILWIHLKTI